MDNTATGQRKKDLRRAMAIAARHAVLPTPETVESRICSLPQYAESSLVLAYVPFKSEVDVSKVIDRAILDGKTVAVPDAEPGLFRICEPNWRADLRELSNKCLCPANSSVLNIVSLNSIIVGSDKLKGIILVPGLAFTEFGTRLGRGAGYYDQLLELTDKSKSLDLFSIGICSESQLVDDLPQQPHDRKVRMVITF